MMMMKRLPLLVFLALLPVVGQALKVEPVGNPSAAGSLQPNWSVTSDGGALLSWVEPTKDGSLVLRYAVRRGQAWSEARTVAANRHFFRHPAEVPEVMQVSDKLWMAHWVEMPKEGSEAEFVYVSSSIDGVHWAAPLMAHKDRGEVEHGLASMAVNSDGEISLFWLITPKGEDGPGYLMRTVVDATGKEIKEERLDSDICSCCPTAVARTAKGLLLAYRDHTPEDIRDIAVMRLENGRWSPSKIIHADNWKLDACPTNAAAVSAKADRAALSWFTAAQDKPRVQAVFSSDSGSTFTKPVLVSTGRAFGYTSIALDDDGSAFISWLEDGKDGASGVMVRQVTAAGVGGPVTRVATGGRMGLGYPRILHTGSGTFIAWGNARPGSKIETAELKP